MPNIIAVAALAEISQLNTLDLFDNRGGLADRLVGRLFANLEDAAVLFGVDGRIITANAAAASLFRCSGDALVGRPVDALQVEPEAELPAMVQGKRVHRYVREDGTEFDGESAGAAVEDRDGCVIGHFAIIRDVSRRVSTDRTIAALHRVTSDRSLDFESRLKRILALGCEQFQLDLGILSKVDGETYVVIDAIAPEAPPPPGTLFAVGDTYCCHTLAADGPVGFHHAGHSEIRTHPCYKTFGLEAYLGAPVMVDGRRFGTLNFSSPKATAPFRARDLELIQLFARWVGHELARQNDIEALAAAHRELEHRAEHDILTGLYNRAAAETRLAREIARVERYGRPLSLVLLDIDHFKRINDTYGHGGGDAALRAFSALAEELGRDTDIVARWGGEEFLVILPETDAEGAMSFANRLREKCRSLTIVHEGHQIQMTMSGGAIQWTSNSTVSAAFERVDEALYAAKEGGRDRIVLAAPIDP